jgi:thioredoxin-dependent peroxiredoxin
MLTYIKDNFWFILFVLWGLPLSYYRSKFRKIVYQTESWIINIKPVFVKEIKALFGNMYPNNSEYKKMRNFYLLYLGVYLILFLLYLFFSKN